jgi:RNA polymerase sigma-70 factor (ECF subfamily)
MTDSEWLAGAFEEHREHLRAVAYRLLGSMSDADDAVQDTWLRLTSADAGGVENLGGWLTTVVARVSLNMLRARRRRPEQPVGDSWPGPVEASAGGGPVAGAPGAGAAASLGDPENEAVLADSVGLALLVVLDTLTAAERLAFVLHDMFAMPFIEVADVLGRTPEATRQLASRRAAGSAAPPARTVRPTSPGSGRSPPRSLPPPAAVTCRPLSHCLILTSRSPAMPPSYQPDGRPCCTVQRRSPPGRSRPVPPEWMRRGWPW